jgi:hypothetical protein
MSEQDPLVVKPEIKLSDALGKKLICEDGIARFVRNITFSYGFRDKCIINETENQSEDGTGYFIHTLSLISQLQGKGVPSKEAMQAATKVWATMYYEEGEGPLARLRSWKKSKGGILHQSN